MFEQQMSKLTNDNGFIAALDQSGGSTPKALKLYGVEEDSYHNDEEMFALVHAMRSRIMTDDNFTGERILGAILFEDTLDREVLGLPTAEYLWKKKKIVPFLKVDKGLADETGGVQMMKPIPGLIELLKKAKSQGVFGTKMRSVIKIADTQSIQAVVAQQFEVGKIIIASGLVPIIEPEIDIHCPDKAAAETLLKSAILDELNKLEETQKVMLKLTLPNQENFYSELIAHPHVVRVVALSGGYPRDEANAKLMANKGMIASFSRALSEGLSAQQSDEMFSQVLDMSIESIYQASCS